MKLIKTALAAAALTGIVGGAQAAELKYIGNAAISGKNVFVGNAPGVKQNNGYAASFKMRDETNALGLGTDFIAFCVDLAGIVATDNYKINNAAPFDPGRKLTSTQVANVNKLFDAAYDGVDTNDVIQASAFQLALWEAAYETVAGALSLTTGTRFGFSTDAGGAIASKAQEYLDLMTGTVSDVFTVNFLDAEKDRTQDLVMAVRNPAAVPLPGAAVLLLGGLGAMGALRKRSRKS